MKRRGLILLVLLSIVIAGCGSFETPAASPAEVEPQQPVNTQPSPPATPGKNPIQPTEPSGAIEMPATHPPAEKFVDLAKKDLASQMTITTEQITLVDAMEIVWPDAALGCPAPGKVYAQGRVPGYKISLEAGGQEYVYHTDLTGQVVLCPDVDPDNPASLSPSGPTQDPNIGVPIQ